MESIINKDILKEIIYNVNNCICIKNDILEVMEIYFQKYLLPCELRYM